MAVKHNFYDHFNKIASCKNVLKVRITYYIIKRKYAQSTEPCDHDPGIFSIAWKNDFRKLGNFFFKMDGHAYVN